MSEPRDDLAYYWYLRASQDGEPVGLDLFRLQWRLGVRAAWDIEDQVQNGDVPDEPRIIFPLPLPLPECPTR